MISQLNWLLPGVLALGVAFALDRWLGAPPLRFHPVTWMGRYLGWIGGLIAPREALPSPNWSAFSAGALAWYGGGMLCVLAAWVLQAALQLLPPVVAAVLLGVLLQPMLAWRSVRDEVAGVEAGLAQSLDAGRRRLGRIVSRDVMRLDATEVREGAIRTLAARLDDSLVAPVFWFVVAGLPGAVLYRFAHTADAMWGFHGFRAGVHWEWAGKWAARADDVLAWLPSRFTALLLALGAGGVPLDRLRTEAHGTPSPNSGWAVSAMALGLGLRLRPPGASPGQGDAPAPQAGDIGRALALCRVVILLLAAWSVLMLAALGWGRTW